MSQIIVIRKPDKLRELIRENIEDYLGHQAIIRNDVEDAVSMLNIVRDVSLIIIYPEAQADLENLDALLNDRDIHTKIICITDKDNWNNDLLGFEYISPEEHWLTVIKIAADILRVNIYDMANNMLERYSPFATADLYLFERIPFNIYEKTVKGEKENFKVVLKMGEKISSKEVRALIKQGNKYLFVEEDNLIPFITVMVERFEIRQRESHLDPNQSVSTSIELHNQTLSILHKMGYHNSSAIETLVESTINSLIEMWLKKKRLSKLLNILIRSNGNLLFQHFTMTAIIAAEMYEMMSDIKNDENTQKLVYASFLHDISIYYNFNLIRVYTNEGYDLAKLGKYDRKRIWSHAKDSAQIARELEVPEGVENMILHHHGAMDGLGFSDEISETFSPLTHILIIAERFSFHVIEAHYFSNEELNVTKIINNIFKEFPEEEHQYIEHLKEVFIIERKLQKYDETSNAS